MKLCPNICRSLCIRGIVLDETGALKLYPYIYKSLWIGGFVLAFVNRQHRSVSECELNWVRGGVDGVEIQESLIQILNYLSTRKVTVSSLVFRCGDKKPEMKFRFETKFYYA